MICLKCNTINDEDSVFCKKCGNNFYEEEVEIPQKEKKQKQKLKKITKTKVVKKKVKNNKDKKSKKNTKVVKEMSITQKLTMLFLCILCILLFSGLAVSLYYIYTNQFVEVPNVENISYDRAEEILSKSDLKIKKVEKNIEDSELDNIVIKQNKKAKSKVSKNSTIRVTVGLYEEKYIVQDFSNMYIDTVKKILDNNGISYDIDYKISDDVENDTIISQSISPNAKISKGDKIKLIVSKNDSKKEDEETTEIEEDKIEDDSEETSTE